MANTIEILVSANVEASIEQLNKDIDKIHEQLKTKKLEVPVDARIKNIAIDKSAASYVSKEISKMFNTVTVDIDGNVLGFGKATGIRKQAENVQKAILDAQKKLSNAQTDYLPKMDESQLNTLNAFVGRLSNLRNNVDTTGVEVKAFVADLDVFTHTLAKNTKSLNENAAAARKQYTAVESAGIEIQKKLNNVQTDYGGEGENRSWDELSKLYDRLATLRSNPNTTVMDMKQLAADVDEYTHALAKNTKEIEANDKAEKVRVNAVNTAILDAQKKLSALEIKYEGSMKPGDQESISTYKTKLEDLGKDSTATALDVKKVTNEIIALGQALKDAATAEQDAANQADKAENERLQAIKQLTAAQQELLNSGTALSGMYGDYKLAGSYKDGAGSSYQKLSEFVEDFLAHAPEMNEQTRKLFDDWNKGDSIDFSKLSAGLNTYIANLTKQTNVGTEEIQEWIDKIKQLQTVLNTDKLSIRVKMDAEQDEASMTAFQNSLASDIQKLDEFYSKYYKIRLNGSMAQQYQDLRNDFTNIKAGDTAELKRLEGQLTQYIARAKEAGLTSETLGDKMQKAFQKFGGWSLVTGIIMKAVSSIRTMISTVIELDSALTELKKVTDETTQSYDAFMDRTRSTAKEIGATMSDVVSATASWARLGFDITDAETLAKASLIYSNVGDELEGVDEASEHLISTMQAFKIEASDVMTIVDQLNTVGNTEAISSGGVGEALSRSGAALEAAGNSLQESMAMIAAMNTTLQDPDSVGELAPNNAVMY